LSNSTSTCIIDFGYHECPVYTTHGNPNEDCQTRPAEITFKYNGGSCAQSDNLQAPEKFSCTDSNGGPPTLPGTQSYITATTLGGSDLYFAGPVEVGEKYTFQVEETLTLNENGQFRTLSSDITITIFESQGGVTFQTTNMQLSCSRYGSNQPFFLNDKFGASAINGWVEPSGRGVANADTSIDKTGMIQVEFYSSNEQMPVRIVEMTAITNTQDQTIDITPQYAGKIFQPGTKIKLPELKYGIDLYREVRYTFNITIIGESLDGTNQCNGIGQFECIRGSNSNPTGFPTMTPSPTITPFPTIDIDLNQI
jgi:hypothetical protein